MRCQGRASERSSPGTARRTSRGTLRGAFGGIALLLVLAGAGLGSDPEGSWLPEARQGAALFAPATEAPAGFDGASNGFAEEVCARQDELVNSPNSPKIPASECSFAAAEAEFAVTEGVSEGIGPIFNATSCAECHTANPSFDPDNFARKLVGATSEITERRAAF